MKIEIKTENGNAKIKVSGRLDTITAPELEKELDTVLPSLNTLIFDMEELEYISSAGLRILLKSQKAMKTNGEMKLINVNENIMEVFEITGFTDILIIE